MNPAELHSLLTVFNPFLARQFGPLREEAETNKAFHLGRKEFAYRQTLNGHQPIYPVPATHENIRSTRPY